MNASRGYAFFAVVLCAALLWLGLAFGFSLFHTATELIASVIAFAIFTVSWNTRGVAPNRYFEVLGIAFLFAGTTDLLHLLTYGSLSGLPAAGSGPATQLWLAGRVTLAAGVLIAPFATGREPGAWPVRTIWVLGMFVLAVAVGRSLVSNASSEAVGLPRFAVVGGIAATACFLAGWWLLVRRRDAFEPDVYRLLSGFFIVSAGAEAALLTAGDTQGPLALGAHLLRVVAFLLVYRAAAVATLARPYETLFREVQHVAEALKASEELLSATVAEASVGIVRLDADGSVLMANPRALEITGRDSADLVGRPIATFTKVDDPASLRMSVARLQSGEIKSFHVEAEMVRPDGDQVLASVALSSVCDECGEPQYFIGVLEDVTELRRAERTLKRSRDLNAALAAIDMAINSTSDEDEIVRRATEATREALSSDAAAALSREESSWLVRCSFGFEEDLAGRSFAVDSLLQASEAVETGLPVAIDDVRGTTRVNQALVEQFSLTSTMAVPLLFRDEVLGVIYVLHMGTVHEYTEPELEFARKLASSLSLAIENARLHSSERIVADTLQAALLVAPASLPGLDVGAAYESAAVLSRVGGDFYDVFPLGDTRIAFVTGDVAGKGLEAATFTAAARTTIRAFALQTGSPSEALAAANQALSSQLEADRFVTCIIGVIDVADGSLRLASAGHPEPALCNAYGCEFRDIDRSPPLGVMTDATFSEYRAALEAGDRIVVFTDGLLDARYGTALFGEDGVLAVLQSADQDAPADAARLLLDAARGFSGGRLKDDIAVVVLDYAGPPRTPLAD